MRPNPWIFPLLALLATGGWIVSQKRGAAALEHDIGVLETRVRKARAAEEAEANERESADKQRKEKERKFDWKGIAGKLGQANNLGLPDIRTSIRMQRLLMDLSVDELCAQLDEIDALDIADNARRQLHSMILDILTEKDPKRALERFGGNIGEDEFGMSWQMSGALRKWAEKDPAAAAVWLDRQLAEGKMESKSLDGKNPTLARFEGSLVSALLQSDPAAAAARVKALPEEQREELFQEGAFQNLAKNDEAAFARVVRASIPADKAGGILANTAQYLAMRGGYERVDGFITSTNASDAEKEAIVMEVMKGKPLFHTGPKLSDEEFDKARAWAVGQAPAVADKATGEALAIVDGDFGRISELVLKYNGASADDGVLAAFLKHNQMRRGDPEEAMKLIEKIKDPALREEIRSLPQYQRKPAEP